jgi:2-amino-4-hydroxy-6-hydroxymethyldihydropteridine diphosphokinase
VENVAFIGIGSNLGEKTRNCESAIERLAAFAENQILGRSSLYKTEPVGYRDQDWFVNCVVKIGTLWGPHELFCCLQNVEKAMGRQKTFLWGPRVIDLDLLLYNEDRYWDRDVQIPHPRLHERAFVLVPLCEIAPETVHPGLGKTVMSLLEMLGEVGGVEKM